jgi:molecular chaperone IbpA
MTAIDLINKFNKDVWNHSDKIFGDVFDNMFSNMSMNSAMKSFPFYNVVKYGKGEYGIELGLAGFNKKNVKVQYKDGVLTISGQGLAARKFLKQFSLHQDVVVNDAKMEDGVLTVKLGVNEPEEIKPIDIEVK